MEKVFIAIIAIAAVVIFKFTLNKMRDDLKYLIVQLANEQKEATEELVQQSTMQFVASRLWDGMDLLKEILNYFKSGSRREAMLIHELTEQLEDWYQMEGFPYLGREERKRFKSLFKQHENFRGSSHLSLTSTNAAQTERYIDDVEDLYERLWSMLNEDREKLLGNYEIVAEAVEA